MLSLHTNTAALSTQRALSSTNKALGQTGTQLGSGYRVNSAMDDAAGLQIATRLEAQSRGMKVAQRNTQNGVSMQQTAEGAMHEIQNMLIRMKDLATESANGTASTQDRQALQAEYDALGQQSWNIVRDTTFAGSVLFAGPVDTSTNKIPLGGVLGTGDVTFQIGASADEQMVASYVSASNRSLATAWSDLFATSESYRMDGAAGTEIETQDSARDYIATLETAIASTSMFRSALGASANRLEHTFNNLGNMIQNTEVARGRILDVDYASATSEMTKQQMLMQTSTALLKQASQMGQMVASLLQ